MTSNALQKSTKVNPEFTFNKEDFSGIMFELPALFDEYQKESKEKDLKLDIDWEKYLALERQGVLHIQTVRKEGQLVGCCVAMITTSLRYRGLKIAYSDMLFVLPPFRKGTGVGPTLIEKYEAMLKDLGVHKSIAEVDVGPLTTLLRWIGYRPTQEVLSKDIG